MISIATNINYFSLDGLPWIFGAWLGLILFRPFATFVHEIGHTIPALILTRKEVYIRVGESGSRWRGKFGNILWEFSLLKGREGFSGYDKNSLNKFSLIIIILGGIGSSLLMSCIIGWQIFSNQTKWKILSNEPSIILETLLVSWFCANSLVFLRSIIPVKLKPTSSFPEGPPSDGLELIRIFQSKNN